ncbi:MAG: hypothetical protein NDI91_04210 [Sulfuritalea sp.]|nr:hypothetical protein [Sulfuritalea sp.]
MSNFEVHCSIIGGRPVLAATGGRPNRPAVERIHPKSAEEFVTLREKQARRRHD